MKTGEYNLWNLIGDDKNKYIIPNYQRIYTWEEENWETLWMDIQNIKEKKYFLGVIVSVGMNKETKLDEKEIITEYTLIDGHQRLITMIMLKKALLLYCKNANFQNLINEKLCGFEYFEKEWDVFKKHSKDLKEILEIETSKDLSEIDPRNTFLKCFDFFDSQIVRECKNISQIKALKNRLNNLLVSTITLNENEDPQLVFDSINSKGKTLNDFERINNFIILTSTNFNKKNGRNLIKWWQKTYFNLLENSKKNKKLPNSFMRTFLILCFLQKIKDTKTYFYFKWLYENKFKEKDSEFVEFMKYIYICSKQYLNIYNFSFFNDKSKSLTTTTIGKIMKNILTLSNTTMPLLLLLSIELYEYKTLNNEDCLSIVKALYSYIMRRVICDLSRNQDDGIIYICKELMQMKKENMGENELWKNDTPIFLVQSKFNILKGFNTCLLKLYNSNESSKWFPNDDEFKMSLLKFNSKTKNKEKRLLLEGINDAFTNNVSYNDTDIEHIFPQNPKKDYQEIAKLKDSEIEFLKKNLNALGNITLLWRGDNIKGSNKTWCEKLARYDGDNKGRFYINYYFILSVLKRHNIKYRDRFTPEIFKIRRDWLIDNACTKAWPLPTIIKNNINEKNPLLTNRTYLVLNVRDLSASASCIIEKNEKGKPIYKDFIIEKGSHSGFKGSKNHSKWIKIRDKLLNEGKIKEIKRNYYEFIENCKFKNPTIAAGFIAGSDGFDLGYWKIRDNKTISLREYAKDQKKYSN